MIELLAYYYGYITTWWKLRRLEPGFHVARVVGVDPILTELGITEILIFAPQRERK